MSQTPPGSQDPLEPQNSLPAPVQGEAQTKPAPDPNDDVEQNRAFAVLAYLGILFLVPLIAAQNSPYARFHTNQGLTLFIFNMAMWLPLCCLIFVPFVNLLACLILPFAFLISLTFFILGVVNAIQGKLTPLPLIGGIAIIK